MKGKLAQIASRWRRLSCGIGTLALLWGAIAPVEAAERVRVRAGFMRYTVPVEDIERFAETGDVSAPLRPVQPLLTSDTRDLLRRRLRVDPNIANRLLVNTLRSPEMEDLIAQLGIALPDSDVEKMRVALYFALRESDGLSAVSFLRAYPQETITIDVTAALEIAVQINLSNLQSRLLDPVLQRELAVDGAAEVPLPKFDPAARGSYTVHRQTLVFRDRSRDRTIPADIYYTSERTSAQLVVLSHGYAADRRFLAYLAQHLASHGYTVVSLEHPGSNLKYLAEVPTGLSPAALLSANEFINRPRDISFLLDELAQIDRYSGYFRGKFNTEEVTVIGHSLGGYTALALAGGELDARALRLFCLEVNPLGRSPADWLQCAAADLPHSRVPLRDRRVVQAIAFNPVVGQLFGNQGLSKVSIPVMMLSGSEDAITPALHHQLRPFHQLGGDKYLLSAGGGTHMSVTDLGNSSSTMGQSTLVRELMGREAEPIRAWVRGTALAFLKQRSPQAEIYQPFLSPTYAQYLSTPKLALRLTNQLPGTMAPWLKGLRFSDTIIAQPQKSRDRSRKHFISRSVDRMRGQLRPRTQHCVAQLHNIFGSIASNDGNWG